MEIREAMKRRQAGTKSGLWLTMSDENSGTKSTGETCNCAL